LAIRSPFFPPIRPLLIAQQSLRRERRDGLCLSALVASCDGAGCGWLLISGPTSLSVIDCVTRREGSSTAPSIIYPSSPT